MARTWMKTVEAAASDPVADPQAELLRLFGQQGTPLYRFCRSVLRDGQDAEDVVQDTFLKLLQHLRASGDRRNLRGWLFTVAANGCRDRVRRRFRWLPWSAELDLRTVSAAEERPDPGPARRAMVMLPPRDRLLLSLRA